jgi:hypothetical protein
MYKPTDPEDAAACARIIEKGGAIAWLVAHGYTKAAVALTEIENAQPLTYRRADIDDPTPRLGDR